AVKGMGAYDYRGQPLLAWLYRIAHNTVSSHYRTTLKHRVVALSTITELSGRLFGQRARSKEPEGPLEADPGAVAERMDLRKALADCIAQMERGAGVEQCLTAHPSHADELRPHLEAWQAMTAGALVQPSAAAFESGRRAMFRALETPPATFSPLAAARLAPAWATVAAAVAAFLVLMGGAAGASAALGGPDPAGDVLSVVGVSSDGPHGVIGESSASDRGLECANPNTFEGSANSEDKAQNADDAHQKQSCSKGTDESNTTNQAGAGCEDANNGNGND